MPSPDFKKEEAILVIRVPVVNTDELADEEFVAELQTAAAEQYRAIVSALTSAEAYPQSRIIIENNTIYIGHTLGEIQASFPKAATALVGHREFKASTLEIETFLKVNYQNGNPKQLEADAKEFMDETLPYIISPAKYAVDTKATPDNQLLQLVNKNEGIVIGESHRHISPKKLLFDNMAELKKQGVDTIYMEHLMRVTHQKMLDDYFASPSDKMPVMLRDYLIKQDRDQLVTNDPTYPYSFLGVVMQAKQQGIRVVAFDNQASYVPHDITKDNARGDPDNRCLYMNYLAAKTVQEDRTPGQGKYIVFCGSKHINNSVSEVNGITELLGTPSVLVQDKEDLLPEEAAITQTDKVPDVSPHIRLECETTLTLAALQFREQMRQQLPASSVVVSQPVITPLVSEPVATHANTASTSTQPLQIKERIIPFAEAKATPQADGSKLEEARAVTSRFKGEISRVREDSSASKDLTIADKANPRGMGPSS